LRAGQFVGHMFSRERNVAYVNEAKSVNKDSPIDFGAVLAVA